MSLSEVSNVVWRERQVLELLVFKLEEEQLVLASGRTRWLSNVTREVETVLEEIKCVELERAMALAGSASSLGMSEASSLRELAVIAPTPWDGIFAEHRRALLSLAEEIDAITTSNRDMLRQVSSGATYAGIETIENQNSTNASARELNLSNVEDVDMAQVLMNLQAAETTYQAALAATAKAIQPSLAAFLQ